MKNTITTQDGTVIETEITTKEVKDLVGNIVPGIRTEGIGIITDKIKGIRWERQLEIIHKTNQKAISLGITLNKINEKAFVSILENGSLESENSLQEKWVNLLTNSISGKNIKVAYSEILKQLDATEVYILDDVYETINDKEVTFGKPEFIKKYKLKDEEGSIIIDNFLRLRICGSIIGTSLTAKTDSDQFKITSLGKSFIKACRA